MNQLPPNSLENTAAVFHQVATGENRRRSRYIKLENGKDVFTNQRRERTDLRVVFDDAQSQIRDALLNVTDASRAEASRFLTDIEHDTVTIGTRYRRRAGNIFVRLGIIKPRVKRETLEKGEQLIRESRAARRILEAKTNPRHYDLNLEDRFSNLKMDLRDLCSHDSDYLFKLLQLSERGGSFEYCRKELEEIATNQFQSLFQSIQSVRDSQDCVFERGRWVLREVEQLTPEMIADRDKRLSDQFYDYLSYINYHWNTKELRVIPIRLNKSLGDLWRRLGQGRIFGGDFQKQYHPTREELPIWLKLAKDFNYSWLLQAVYISVVPSDGREGFYDELKDSVDTLDSIYPRFFENPSEIVKAFYKLANSGLAGIPEFRAAAQLTGVPYAYFFDGIEPAPPQDYLVFAVHKILKDYDFPKSENFEIVTSLVEDMFNLYGFQIYEGTIPENYRFSELLTLLQKEWLQNPQYKALVCEHIPIIRKMLTPADVPEENNPVEAAILEVYGALKRNEIKTPQEAEEILNGIFHLSRRYEKAFNAIDNEEPNLKKLFSKFSLAHKKACTLLEPFADDHPIKRLMGAPPLPEGSTLNRRVLAFILSKIASGELEDFEKAEQIYRDVMALSGLNQKFNADECTNEDYQALLKIAERGIAKDQALLEAMEEDIPLLRVFADPQHVPVDATFELKVLALVLQTAEPSKIICFRYLKAFEEDQQFLSESLTLAESLIFVQLMRCIEITEDTNPELIPTIQQLFPRSYELDRLVHMREQENEPLHISVFRHCFQQDDIAQWISLIEAFHCVQKLFSGDPSSNRRFLKFNSLDVDKLSEATRIFLKEKLPFALYVMEVKKRTPNEDSFNEKTPIDDLLLWGQDFLSTYRQNLINIPFEEEYLAYELLDTDVFAPKIVHRIGRKSREGFKPTAELDDAFISQQIAALDKVIASERVKKAFLVETAISPEYALALQEEYGLQYYDDRYNTQKKLFQNENSGDCVVIINGKERRIHSQLIQRALPEKVILDQNTKTIKFPEQLTPEETNAFLEYCYTESIAKASDVLLMSLYLKSEFIGSEAFRGFCCCILIASVSKENVLKRYQEACRLGIEPLKQHCVRFLQAHHYSYRESFTEEQKREIGKIVKTFFSPPVVTPQTVRLDPVELEPNFTLYSTDEKAVPVNLDLLAARSGYFSRLINNNWQERVENLVIFEQFDINTLSLVAQFVSNGKLPPNLSDADLIKLKEAADYFDMPAMEFQLNVLSIA